MPENATSATGGFSTFELLTKTLALWLRAVKIYIIICGIPLAMIVILKSIVSYSLYGSILLGLFADNVASFLTMVLNAIFFPAILHPSYSTNLLISLAFLALGTLVGGFVTGCVIQFAHDDISSGEPRMESAISAGFSKLAPVLFIHLLVSTIWGICLAPGQVMMAYGISSEDFQMLANGLSLYIAFGVIAVIVLARIVIAPAVIVVENTPALSSLDDASNLTRGQVVHIVLGWILVLVTTFLIDITISGLFSSLVSFIGNDLAVLLSAVTSSLLVGPMMYIFMVIVYVDMKLRAGVAGN